MVAAKKGLTGLEIRIELMRRGIKLVDIAARAGVKPPAVTRMLSGKDQYKGRRLRPVIAEALGLPEDEIWPPEVERRAAR
ncbi:Winged helix-turn-helix DNA-binding [Desulfofundulus thermosubterraneus DSM 16057]|uniref:Winged helix-turn-helix DNA-binding n=1 Tax=Desulfofundulus thermosubterraneus DSM 16057 TaxID=1121432 RepID=A0A1M6KJQ9_9FIRM|nr:Winged helix-turn-helix DNA-binding [Desulfofundulus thermosubterraneus DSM 16057]